MSKFNEWWCNECTGITFDYPVESAEYAFQAQQAKIDAANEILKNIVVYEQDIHAINQINKLKDLLK